MNIARCRISVSSITQKPSFESLLVSQLLYGEYCEILREEGYFSFIRVENDGVEGWVFSGHLQCVNAVEKQEVLKVKYMEKEGQLFSLGAEFSENELLIDSENQSLDTIARSCIGIPYLHGGRSVFGMDADGFTQLMYKSQGFLLPRKASEQVQLGVVLDFIEESSLGDLAFFENENSEIIHVGMMLENLQIIHVFGEVRIDDLDISGIYNQELKRHTHKLRCIKRIL